MGGALKRKVGGAGSLRSAEQKTTDLVHYHFAGGWREWVVGWGACHGVVSGGGGGGGVDRQVRRVI